MMCTIETIVVSTLIGFLLGMFFEFMTSSVRVKNVKKNN